MRVSGEEHILLARCAKRKVEDLYRLSSKFGPQVYGFLYCVLGDQAKDFERPFCQAFTRTLERYRPHRQTKPFLIAVLEQLVILLEQHDAAELPIRFSEERNPRIALIGLTLAGMDWYDRMLITLRDPMGLSHEEMAAVLRVPGDSLKKKIKKAREHFRSALGEQMKAREIAGDGMSSDSEENS